ncbi:class I SAM-dependent methyltransferase [Oligoflexus tunisiensis]|uniref:class I SAM-dependent methyltransferase n=1 Tax=Oligoflexus tunisiensis TaxID=708132 RepID=UPI000A6EA2CF|nr:class I SAM-dependent methyltransferase [Oligoflexus tunisiensis]
MYETLTKCRICGNQALTEVVSLGTQSLTGKFPRATDEEIQSIPLELVKCDQEKNASACGLLQLLYTGKLEDMYGEGYGYRSSLNPMMVKHLAEKVKKIEQWAELEANDLVLDIGSNDATTLKQYSTPNLMLVGIDPSGRNFMDYYPEHIRLIPEFFSAQSISGKYGAKKARIITSFSMFYDLEDPMNFMMQVFDTLEDGGLWVFEQSYMPTMLNMNSYDTICHEHLEYYGLHQIKWMTDRVGLKILDVELNNVNGGSFSIIAQKPRRTSKCDDKLPASAAKLLKDEIDWKLHTMLPYRRFASRCEQHRSETIKFFEQAKRSDQIIYGYGASTKGNVLLQYCQISADQMPFIAEVNKDKFGAFTPGTNIPIIPEHQARENRPDFFFVLPWHFRQGIIQKEREFLNRGGKLVFPLPHLDVVDRTNARPDEANP